MRVLSFIFSCLVFSAHALAQAPSGSVSAPVAVNSPTPAPEKPGSILVLDVSGSMWGQVDGKAKIYIARDVVADLIKNWKESEDLGLVAYGHRTKGDCNDIETLVKPGPLNKKTFMDVVNTLTPRGKTPLTAAVTKAAEDLKFREEPATVILLTDGLETCEADPCAAAKKLEEAGVNLTVHVVGFDIQGESDSQLRCIAENTGGKYLPAANASELMAALVKMAHEPPPPAPVAPPPPPPVVDQKPEPLPQASLAPAPADPEAGRDFSVTWQGPREQNDAIQLVRPKAVQHEEVILRSVGLGQGNAVILKAPDQVGLYEVRYMYAKKNAVIGRAQITVKPVQAQLTAPDAVNAGSEFQVTWTGPGNEGDQISVAPVGSPVSGYKSIFGVGVGPTGKLKAPDQPGVYELRYVTQQGSILATRPITIQGVGAQLTAPDTVNAGSEFQVAWTGPGDSGDRISVAPVGSAVSGYKSIFGVERGPTGTLKAPDEPGTYELRYVTMRGTIVVTRPITVQAVTARIQGPTQVNAASPFEAVWEGPANEGDNISIAPVGSAVSGYKSIHGVGRGSPAKLEAPDEPGAYELRYVTSRGTIVTRTPIQVMPITAKVSGPSVVKAGTEFEAAWDGPKNSGDVVTFAPVGSSVSGYKSMHYTERGSPAKLKAPLQPGPYELRYSTRRGTILARQPITVQ